MGRRHNYIGERLRNSYWFVPTIMLVGAAVLAWITTNLDDSYSPEKMRVVGDLIYSGGTDGAREVLGTIASSMITVAGVVFSITIVSLQLASSQFGPRMLANFMRDRGNQITFGTFIATFLYCLLVLFCGLSLYLAPALDLCLFQLICLAVKDVDGPDVFHQQVDVTVKQAAQVTGYLAPAVCQRLTCRSPDDAQELVDRVVGVDRYRLARQLLEL